MKYFQDLRKEYTSGRLNKKDLNKDPFIQFDNWLQFAIDNNILMPNAMSLATTNNDEVSLRTVLLKEVKAGGFVFFTDYRSKKAQQINQFAQVALLFTWLALDRQIKISGKIKKTSLEDNEKYFKQRPKDAQIAAYTSKQSQIVKSREALESQFYFNKNKFFDKDVPLIDWGGYIVLPNSIEFWQGRPNRLHDRFRYTKNKDNDWEINRLSP